MRDTIDMAREAGWTSYDSQDDRFKAFEALVRADERSVEREQGQKWFDAVTAQYKAEILAEREACAKIADTEASKWGGFDSGFGASIDIADAIRARGNT